MTSLDIAAAVPHPVTNLETKELGMDLLKRTSVSSHDLEDVMRAVERANFLNDESAQSALLDPCCMLDALSDVYAASRRLVQESCQWSQALGTSSAP